MLRIVDPADKPRAIPQNLSGLRDYWHRIPGFIIYNHFEHVVLAGTESTARVPIPECEQDHLQI